MSTPLDYLPTKPRKALAAIASTLLSGLGIALLEDGALTRPEVGGAIGAALLAGAAVWRVRNPLDAAKLGKLRDGMPLPADISRELRGRHDQGVSDDHASGRAGD